MSHDVFISHSSINKNAADAICHALENNGIKCWIAPRDIPHGAKYGAEITKGLRDCKVFLLVFSDEVNKSEAVQKEIERAIIGYKKPCIPFYIEDVPMNDNIEFFISDAQRIDAYKEKHWMDAYPDSRVFNDLVLSVRNMLGMSADTEVRAGTKKPKSRKKTLLIGASAAILTAGLIIGGISLFGGNGGANQDPLANGGTEETSPAPSSPGEISTVNPTASTEPNGSDASAEPGGDSHDDLAELYFSDLPIAGATSGNILNGGLAVTDGEYIYFASNDFSIYRFDPDTMKASELIAETGNIGNLNYYNGKLYYTIRNNIKELNMSDASIISLSSASVDKMYVENDTIYYTNQLDHLALWSLSLDGRVSTKVNDVTGAQYHVVSNGYYYYSDDSAGLHLFRTNLDGSGKTELSNQETHWANIIGEYVFYSDLGNNPKLVRAVTGGGESETISQLPTGCLNVVEDGLIYANGIANSAAFRMSFDGKTETKLTDFPVTRINVVLGWVFLIGEGDDELYVMRTDGTDLVKAADLENEPYDGGGGAISNAENVTDQSYTIVTSVYEMDVIYTGQWRDGKPDGDGTAIVAEDIPGRFTTGDTLEGTWVQGLLEGPGVYISGDYMLEGVFIAGLKEGTVKQYYRGEFIGEIEFKNGSPS